MSSKRGFTRASSLGPIAEFVEQAGGNIERVFSNVDIPIAILDKPDLPLPLPEQFKLLQSAAAETGDAFFGARLGQLVRIENLSSFGKWVSSSWTVGEAIDRSNKGLNRFLQTGTNLKIEEIDWRARWSIEFLDSGFEGRFQNELLGVSYLIDCMRSFWGRSWTPDLVRVTGTRSGQASQLEQIFQAPVKAGNRVSSIEFDKAYLQFKRLGLSNSKRPDNIPLDVEPLVPSSTDQYGAIIALMSVAILDGHPRIDWLASKLGLTRRTIQRRLNTYGTSFSMLLDDMLRNRALCLLLSEDMSVTQIALQSGYGDTAHFCRAFKRWTNVSPTAYRNRALGGKTQ